MGVFGVISGEGLPTAASSRGFFFHMLLGYPYQQEVDKAALIRKDMCCAYVSLAIVPVVKHAVYRRGSHLGFR